MDEESGDLGSTPPTHGSESEGKYHKGEKPIVSKRRGNKYMRLSTGGDPGRGSIAFGDNVEGRSALSKARRRVIPAVILTIVIIAYYI